jgi:Asp-tRNA(Asn)/Glu-tRNA(Gln) amidotransferase A subunit family amidase
MPDLASRGPGGLNLMTATQAAAKLRHGSVTSVELIERCLARITARESSPDVAATFTTIAFDDSSLRWFEINT